MIESYYDKLAPFYKLIYQDWESSVRQQAAALHGVIQEYFGVHISRILDAACGIGTQSIGLAELGYSLTASDVSQAAVLIARTEAHKRGLQIEFTISDLRQMPEVYAHQYDLVIACDNAIPHLLSDNEILEAFHHFHRCTTSAGGCIISVRDYATMGPIGMQIYPRTVHVMGDRRVILFDVWQADGAFYDMTTYAVEDHGGETATTHVIKGGRYYCVTISKLESILKEAGFPKTVALRDRFFQPLILGLKDNGRAAT
jgi:SAM-dependent methyltransferase